MTDTLTETVADLMTVQPLAVLPGTPVAEVYAYMEERGVSECPVVGPDGELVGLVSKVDFLRAIRPEGGLAAPAVEDLGSVPVSEIMRSGVVSLEPENPILAALDLFVETRLHALPVVRRGAGKPVLKGIVTQGDVLRRFMTAAVRSP